VLVAGVQVPTEREQFHHSYMLLPAL